MSSIGGKNFSNFQNVRVKGELDGVVAPGAIRFVATSAFESTMAVSSNAEANYNYQLPARSGGFGVTGTFLVQLPSIAAFSYGETMVTVSGMRREDALVCAIRDIMETAVTLTTKAYPILSGTRPENGFINLTFVNPSTTATSYGAMVLGYTTFR